MPQPELRTERLLLRPFRDDDVSDGTVYRGIEEFRLTRIWASTDVRHTRSQRVLEKLGMIRESFRDGPLAARDGTSIREVVYTTNSIESLNARYRRAATACGHFPNEQAALKRIYLATLALDPSGRGRKRWNNKWKAALNEFDQLFDGRLTAGRV